MKEKAQKKLKKETDTEMLAHLMLKGIEEIKRTMATKEELAAVRQEIKGDISSVKEELAEVKKDPSGVKEEVSSVKEEQKIQGRQIASVERKLGDTLLSLDETVHKSEFNNLVRRVEVLEK